MIFTVIGILILLYGFYDLKKGFLAFLVFKIILVTNITLVSLPGVPLLTLDMFLTMAYFGLFMVRRKNLSYTHVPFPYKKPFILLMISWTISTIFAYVGVKSAFSALIGQICQDVVMIWLLWLLVEDEEDYDFLIKWFTAVFFISCVYGFFEKMTFTNPLMEYEISLVGDDERAINFSYEGDENRGGWRVQSVFSHAIGAGINWAMFFCWILTLIYVKRYNRVNLTSSLIVAVLCIPCILFTSSRSPLVFLAISSLCFVNFKNKNFVKAFIAGVVLVIALSPFFAEYANNILSLVDDKAAAEVGGSDADMRMGQLAASAALMSMSPIYGLGYKFMNEMRLMLVDDLMGLESMWFRIMTQFGIIGIVVNLIFAYFSLVRIPLKYRSPQIFFISLAYWVVGTITSVPGMLMYMYYLIIFMWIKSSPVYKQQLEEPHNN